MRPKYYIKVTDALECPRRIALEKYGWKPHFPVRIQRAMIDGTIHEQDIIAHALTHIVAREHSETKDVQYQVELQIPIAEDFYVFGYADAVVELENGAKYVIEAKAVNRHRFIRIWTEGFQAVPNYYAQLQFYMYMVGVKQGVLAVRNVETPRTQLYQHVFIHSNLDEEYVKQQIERLQSYRKLIQFATDAKTNNMPLEEFLSRLPQPYSSDDPRCEYCFLYELCHGKQDNKVLVSDEVDESIRAKLEELEKISKQLEEARILEKRAKQLRQELAELIDVPIEHNGRLYYVSEREYIDVDRDALWQYIAQHPEQRTALTTVRTVRKLLSRRLDKDK